MKHLIALLSFMLFILSCNTKQTTIEDHPFKDMVGTWERQNDDEGKQTFENWEMKNPNVFIGMGFTLQGLDTVFMENLKIHFQDAQWIFEVSGVHEEPISFPMTIVEKKYFTAENDKNPFPKKIAYTLNKGRLLAVISAGKDEILFEFKRKN